MEAEKTRKREIDALDAAMESTRLARGEVITLRESADLETEHGTVTVVPAWRWFLQHP